MNQRSKIFGYPRRKAVLPAATVVRAAPHPHLLGVAVRILRGFPQGSELQPARLSRRKLLRKLTRVI